MPIRPELRKFYGREWREVIRPRILARAGSKCEQCRKPNGSVVIVRFWFKRLWWRRPTWKLWRNHLGKRSHAPSLLYADERKVRVVLTIAHLNHTPGDDREENLKALCQWCHLNYDKLHHHETRSARKDAARPLLAV